LLHCSRTPERVGVSVPLDGIQNARRLGRGLWIVPFAQEPQTAHAVFIDEATEGLGLGWHAWRHPDIIPVPSRAAMITQGVKRIRPILRHD